MKKLLFFVALAATMLFANSCSKEDVATSSNDVQLNFALGINGIMGTRTTVDMTVDQLSYSIFDANGNLLENFGADGIEVIENAFAGGACENVSVSLVKGQTYTIVFWAQDSSCDAYTVTAKQNGLTVDVDYNGGNNDETRDAFYASETFTVEGDAVIDVVLKRPFAQINLGVTAEDWNTAVASGINITKSKATIKNVPTSINLLDGSVSGETAVSYDFASIPTEATRAASNVKTLTVDDEAYKWLSMSYVLTDESKSTLEADGLQFTLETSNGDEIVFDEGLHNVPLQRNWRTNVVGNVLTGNVDFKVAVDNVFYHTATVSNVEDFKAALKDTNVQIIKLEAGVYDLNYVVMRKGNLIIKSADANNPATIMGALAIAAPTKSVEFENLKFDVSDNSTVKLGHQYLDRYERKSIVPIYASQVSFKGCVFSNLYDTRSVVAINYNAHIPGTMLTIDECSFTGYAYTIYSRALLCVTNSTFDQYHSEVNPRAIFLYGLGDGTQGKVIFKNNTAVGKTSYALQMSSTTQPYGAIEMDVRDNTNFSVDGLSFLCHPDRDFSGVTFVEGSDKF